MARKLIQIFIVLMLLASTVNVFMIPAEGASSTPSNGINAVQYINGDWTVSTDLSYTDQIIVLTGNLIIDPVGKLEFFNTTLKMNATNVDGEYGIEVQNGGRFFVNDTSIITTADAQVYGYDFLVSQGGTLEVQNSKVEYCGILGAGPGDFESGLTINSDNTTFLDSFFSDSANGLVADSVNLTVQNCTIMNNGFNGIYMTNITDQTNVLSLNVSDSNITDNQESGIKVNVDNVIVQIGGNNISGNDFGGIQVHAGMKLQANFTANHLVDNVGYGGIGLNASSDQGIIHANFTANNLTDNGGISPIRLGFHIVSDNAGCNEPAKEVHFNTTDNVVWSNHGTYSSQGDGLLMAYATELVSFEMWNNVFFAPDMENGVHVGMLSDEINLEHIWPGTQVVKANIHNNTISNIQGGALKIAASERIFANLTENHIYHPDSKMGCGSTSIGWFSEGVDTTTPKYADILFNNNTMEGIADSGGLGVKAIYNLNLTMENNTVQDVHNGGFIIGWISDTDDKSVPMPWAYPTRNVNAKIVNNTIGNGYGPGIWLYSSNGSQIYNNVISQRVGSYIDYPMWLGDGIRIESTTENTWVHDNQIIECFGSGIRLYDSENVSVYDNVLDINAYALGVGGSSSQNKFFENTITKPDFKYGYYIALDSLNHTFPANNTINGDYLRYYYDQHGTPTVSVSIQNQDIQEPLMSNLGQIVITNSTYLDVFNNIAGNGTKGIAFLNVNNSIMHDNEAVYNDFGTHLDIYSTNNSIYDNELSWNEYGIALENSSVLNNIWENQIIKNKLDTGMYFDTSGSTWNNSISMNNTVNDVPVEYYYQNSSLSLSDGNFTMSRMTNMGQILFIECEDISLENFTVSGGHCGTYIEDSDNISIGDSTFTASTFNINAVDSSNVSINDSEFSYASRNVYLISSTDVVLNNVSIFNSTNSLFLVSSSLQIFNSSIWNSSLNSLYVHSGSSSWLVNTTFEQNLVNVTTIASNLSVSWLLNIQTMANGFPISGSKIILTNDTATLGNYTTDTQGNTEKIELLGYIQHFNYTDDYSAYNLNISKEGYESLEMDIDMSETRSLLVNLSDISSPVISDYGLTPTTSLTSQDKVWLNFTIDDDGLSNSIIDSAEWKMSETEPALNPGLAEQLSSVDGSFDDYIEDFSLEIDLDSFQAGDYTFWIRGSDDSGNFCDWLDIILTIEDDEGPEITGSLYQSIIDAGLDVQKIWINASFDDSDMGGSYVSDGEMAWDDSMPASTPALVYDIIAVDGSFDESEEQISFEIDIDALSQGEYNLQFRAVDSQGNNGPWISTSFSIYDDEAPLPPTDLEIQVNEDGTISLSWSPGTAPDLGGYRIYRSIISGSNYELVATLDANQTTWIDMEVEDGETYYYVVKAIDSSLVPNESDGSEEVGDTAELPSSGGQLWLPIIIVFILVAIILTVLLMGKLKKNPKPIEADEPAPEPELESEPEDEIID